MAISHIEWGGSIYKCLLILVALSLAQGCKTLAKQNDTGVVVARRAQIRSSTAVVAADLLEVDRGDAVDILDFQDVQDPSDNSKKERWLRVQAQETYRCPYLHRSACMFRKRSGPGRCRELRR